MVKEINIATLYMNVFADVINSGDTSLLGVEGHVKVWEQIIEDYNEIIGNKEDFIKWRKVLQLSTLKARLQRVVLGVRLYFDSPLSDENKADLISKLAKDKVKINVKADKITELNRINQQIKAMESNISFKQKEVDAFAKDEKPTKFDAVEQLYTLERVLEGNYKLTPGETTVKEYALRVRDAEKMVKARQNG
jgi:hypothetical protein